MRLYLFYARHRRAMTIGVRAAAFDERGRVFLIRHSYVPGWYLPGGGVEPGETAEEALKRELMEEGGIEVDSAPDLFGIYLNRAVSARDHVVFFVCRRVSASASAADPESRDPRGRLLFARCAPRRRDRGYAPAPGRNRGCAALGGVVIFTCRQAA